MNRSDCHKLVLEAVANDYERLKEIEVEILTWIRPDDQLTVSKTIESVLVECITAGEISAYRLSSSEPFAVEVSAQKQELNNVWFFITPKGRDSLRQL